MAKLNSHTLRALPVLCILCSAVSLWAQPKAGFYATPVKGCNPLKVDFTNTSTNAVSYLWKFGNGNESTLKDPGAVYNNPGKYTVVLIATNSAGLVDSIVLKNYITVFKSPVAGFMAKDNQICEGDSMIFQDQSIRGDAPITSWSWDFGDGGTTSKQQPGYVYTLAGKYDVTLAVRDSNGCESSFKGTRYAQVGKPPQVDFVSDVHYKCAAPVAVGFTETVSGTAPYQYNWTFGDGGSSTKSSPSHTYAANGTYSVGLKITDAYGCSDSVNHKSLIHINPPVANFSVGSVTVCIGDKSSFTNLSSPLDGTGTFLWDFGNGETSDKSDPEVTYSAPGTYTVKLRYNWDGCSDEKTKTAYITVYDRPVGSISPRDQVVCRSGSGQKLYVMNGNKLSTVSWEVNNAFKGNFAASAGYKFPLDVNGNYTIVAYPFSQQGCKGKPDTVRLTVRGPNAAITVDSAEGCIPFNLKADYIGTSDAPIVSYAWKGLGKTGSGPSMNFVKNSFGKTPVMITVTDSNGCTDSSSKMIDGGLRIEPVFETVKQICRNQPFWIHNHTAIQNEDTVYFKYSWDNKDTINFLPKDSIRVKLKDTPDQIIRYTFLAISHGCTTGLDTSKLLHVKILGPKLEASVQSWCDKDSFTGYNKSTHYTRTFWTYQFPANVLHTDPSMILTRKISETAELWVYAYNDTNGCRDSLPFSMKIDPTPASFLPVYNCATDRYTATNKYPNLKDVTYEWVVWNKTTQKKSYYSTRNLDIYLSEPGSYDITLNVTNPAFSCTPPGKATQFVFRRPVGKPSASIDRTTCYPVKLTLVDSEYLNWVNPVWVIQGATVKDTAARMQSTYSGNTDNLWVYNFRSDGNGCEYRDTFKFVIKGIRANISTNQTGGACKAAIVTFSPSVVNSNGALSYFWDFGYKTSTKLQDTVIVDGWKTIFATLVVKDQFGCESKADKIMEVNNGRPLARFTVSDSTIACPPLNVQFTDVSKSGNNPIVKRLWNFGDSSFSDKTNPGKLYIYPGKYSVTLMVTNNIGCSDTFHIPDLVVVNGPFGTYSFDRKTGCTPLGVNLNTKIQGKIKKLEFDMGDGTVLNAGSNQHSYQRPGLYIPLLIVEDSNGCRFSPKPTDTIVVYPTPKTDFLNPPLCDNQVYTFNENTQIKGDMIAEFLWKLDGDSVDNGKSTTHYFNNGIRDHKLFLKAVSSKGCADSIEKPLRVFGITPSLITNKSEYCLGEKAFIQHNSHSDTAIAIRSLWLDGVLSPDIDKVPVTTSKRGKIPAILIVQDVVGCRDTISEDVLLKVGDTLPPPALTMYRTTVEDNFTTLTSFAPSIQPDFKKYNLYVWLNNSWQLRATTKDLNDTSLLVSGLNTLQNSYCHMIREVNYCGMETDSITVIPHCSIEVKARGDTNMSRVWWVPYSGWNQVDRYRIFRKKTDENVFSFLDSVPGNQSMYLDTAIFCHIEYDYRIEGVEKNGNKQLSWSDTARSKPLHFLPVPAPEVWRTTVNDNEYTHTEWITPTPHKYAYDHFTLWKFDGSDWKIADPARSSSSFDFDDLNTKVQSTSYIYHLSATDICGVTSPLSNDGQSIVLSVVPEGPDGDARVQWSPYREWNEGVAEYSVERSVGGAGFSEIGRVDGSTFSFTDTEIPKYCARDFVYRVQAIRAQPAKQDSSFNVVSVSNYDEFVPEIRFFVPNAFTPNGNNLNEGFRPDGVFFYRYEMRIFNRWGQKVYDDDACLNAWDGNYNGEPAPDGVYAYYIRVWDFNDKEYNFSGTVHLLR